MSTRDGHVVGSTRIVDSGPASARWNIAIMGDGYQDGELGQYASDVQAMVGTLLRSAPFDSLRTAINVFRIDVASTQSGAADPAGPPCNGSGDAPRTYFDSHFCTNGIRRLLVTNNATALATAAAQVPEFHVAVVIVNSPVYGGSGGQVGVLSTAAGAAEILLHELGHTAFGLADEYEYYAGCGIDPPGTHDRYGGSEPRQPNVTIDTNRATLKWRQLVNAGTAIPTTRNADCGVCDPQPSPVGAGVVGTFEGAYYNHCGVFRPAFDCRMRAIRNEFCGVCQSVIRHVIEPFLPGPDLCFIKTRNTPNETVEVHIASGTSAYQQRILEVTSSYSIGDEDNGTWQVGPPDANGWPTLYFVKTANTGTGTVEVHYDRFDPAANAYRRAFDSGSLYAESDGANGTWQMYSNAPGAPADLFFIKHKATPANTVEVHAASATSNFQERILDVVSDFAIRSDESIWQVGAPNVNGWPTLYSVLTSATGSGTVEIHWCVYDPGRNSYVRAGDFATVFPEAEGPLGAWQVRTSPSTSEILLCFSQYIGTPGKVLVQAAGASDNFSTRLFDLPSDFAEEADGVWQVLGEG